MRDDNDHEDEIDERSYNERLFDNIRWTSSSMTRDVKQAIRRMNKIIKRLEQAERLIEQMINPGHS